jgi:formylglycine-generating enzyme required for sulfatase activity
MHRPLVLLSCIGCFTLVGCGDGRDDPCVPGASRDCACDGGITGEQTCLPDGWGQCECTVGDGDADADLDDDAGGDADADDDGESDAEATCHPAADSDCDPACGADCCTPDLPRYCVSGDIAACAAADADCSTLSECRGEVFVCGLGERPVCPDEGAPACEPIEGWVVIEAGTFVMGSPEHEEGRRINETLHEVTLTRPVMIQVTEVTREQFVEIVGTDPSLDPDCGETCPVENLSWEDAVTYCNALSREHGLAECYEDCACDLKPEFETPYECPGYRLPTEAEWEYAARAGTDGPRYGPLDDIAWYSVTSGDTVHEVGTRVPNEWGLHDMLGNVAEWCSDLYVMDLGSEPATDPSPDSDLHDRPMRGGAFHSDASRVRAAARASGQQAIPVAGSGLRPVRTLP